jgi:PAS domain
MNLNWGQIERWQQLLQDDDLTELRELFRANGARGPSIKWDPPVDTIGQKPMRFTLDLWHQAATSGLPTTGFVDPIKLAPALGYLLLVDVIDGGRDFAYRLFGTRVSAVSGFDMTRKKLSEHPASPYIREFSIALYRAAIIRREPVWSHYGPAMAVSTAAWERIVLPLVDAPGGTVCRFLVATVPIGLDGNAVKG